MFPRFRGWPAVGWMALLLGLAPGPVLGAVDPPAGGRERRVPADYATVQAAIDAARPGDTVVVARGTYRERLKLQPRVVVRSEGDDTRGRLGLKRAEATLLDGTGGTGPGVQLAEGAVLDGFTVTGVGRYDDALWQRHFDTRGEEQAHEDIGQPGTPGIAVDTDGAVLNNIVHHVGYTGIAITGAPGRRVSPRVLGNVCYRNMGGGIGSMAGSAAQIEGNVCFENFHAGIGHAGASPVVRSNTCHGNIRAGIGISEGAFPTVTGNRCFQNRRAGIGIRTGQSTRPRVEANECFENGMAGIGVEEDAQPVLAGNRCHDNRLAGIGLQDGASAVVTGNDCSDNGESGIGLRGRARAEIVRNRLLNNARVAIGVTGDSEAEIRENELARTGGAPPMIAVLDRSRAVITRNTIHGGGVAGVLVQGRAEVAHNQFLVEAARRGGPPGIAAWVQKGATVDFHHNRVEGWRQALSADGAESVSVRTNEVVLSQGTAIVVKDSRQPGVVTGNVVFSNESKARAVEVHGPAGEVAGNEVKRRSPSP